MKAPSIGCHTGRDGTKKSGRRNSRGSGAIHRDTICSQRRTETSEHRDRASQSVQKRISREHEPRTEDAAAYDHRVLSTAHRGIGRTVEREAKTLLVDHIQRDSHHLLDLINGILDLSKIEAGKLELHLENFNALDALDEVISSVAPLAAAKSISLEQTTCSPFVMNADCMRFKQILYNLLSNAIKFTPERGSVSIKCFTHDALAQFSIAIQEWAFRRASKQRSSISSTRSARRLKVCRKAPVSGLPIAKHLVEQHAGRLWLESEPGTGSRFSFTLPL